MFNRDRSSKPKNWYKLGAEDKKDSKVSRHRMVRSKNRRDRKVRFYRQLKKKAEERKSHQSAEKCTHKTFWARVHVFPSKQKVSCQNCGEVVKKNMWLYKCPRCLVRACRACVDEFRFPREKGEGGGPCWLLEWWRGAASWRRRGP